MLLLTGCTQSSKHFDEANYYFSSNETACAYIFYNVPDAPVLKIENRIINHHFDEDNLLLTSSPEHFGWNNEDDSGFHKMNYYQGDQQMSEQEIFASTGAYQYEGGPEFHFMTLQFDVSHDCLAEDNFEHNDLFKELLERVYGVEIE